MALAFYATYFTGLHNYVDSIPFLRLTMWAYYQHMKMHKLEKKSSKPP
jgi:hypothetical protein